MVGFSSKFKWNVTERLFLHIRFYTLCRTEGYNNNNVDSIYVVPKDIVIVIIIIIYVVSNNTTTTKGHISNKTNPNKGFNVTFTEYL